MKENKTIENIISTIEKTYNKEQILQIKETTYKRYNDLVEKNNDSKELQAHTNKHIYPSIAIYYTLIDFNINPTEAEDIIAAYNQNRAEELAKTFRTLLKIPSLYKFLPSIFASIAKKSFGETASFKQYFYDTPHDHTKFDVVQCPYYDIFKRYNCPHLTHIFCDNDDTCYSKMHPKIIFERIKTLGRGDNCCDFHIYIRR